MSKLFYNLLEFVHSMKSRQASRWSIFLENAASLLKAKNISFSLAQINGLSAIRARESGRSVFFYDRKRGFGLYRNGLKARRDFLWQSYCLNGVSLNQDDVVIDCGANYGDLWLSLEDKIKPENYIAFEPHPRDFKVLEKNINSRCKAFNYALGDSDSIMSFYLDESHGDSSLQYFMSSTSTIQVQVKTLAYIFHQLSLDKIKLLKLEAEGHEPEVLEGCLTILKNIQFIAADGGYERGVNQDQTFTSIVNYLLAHNFEVVDVYFPWQRVLLKNKMFDLPEHTL